jgi:hypothetical protein
VACPSEIVERRTVREGLEAYFTLHPEARAHVLDEQGDMRTHVVVLVDAVRGLDRRRLTDPVAASAEVYVMRAPWIAISHHLPPIHSVRITT